MIEAAAGDFPQISNFNYGSTTGTCGLLDHIDNEPIPTFKDHFTRATRRIAARQQLQQQAQITEAYMDKSTRRIAQIFIADADPDVPMNEALLYRSEPAFTDLTDQELYFEAGIPEKLKAHNEKRVKWLDREATKRAGKDIFLEPIKVRDLRMVVVTIAQF